MGIIILGTAAVIGVFILLAKTSYKFQKNIIIKKITDEKKREKKLKQLKQNLTFLITFLSFLLLCSIVLFFAFIFGLV